MAGLVLEISIPELPALARLVYGIGGVHGALQREFGNAIKKSIFHLLSLARPLTPVNTGFLRGAAMKTEFSTLQGVLKNVAPYATFVHEGTKPHFPPVAAIAPWAERHGLPPFAVARGIAAHGTPSRPFFYEALQKGRMDVYNFFEQAVENILKNF